jgi:hypothetical protein
VNSNRRFRGYDGRPIPCDDEMERELVERWRSTVNSDP